jgi:hypothetical protein
MPRGLITAMALLSCLFFGSRDQLDGLARQGHHRLRSTIAAVSIGKVDADDG